MLKEAVKSLYLRSEACKWVQGKNSDVVGCNKGSETRVHDVTLAVQLSNGQYTEGSKGELPGGVQLEINELQFLLFADDLVLVAENEVDTKRNVEVHNEVIA